MIRNIVLFILAGFMLSDSILFAQSEQKKSKNSYKKEWKTIYKLEDVGLTKTARDSVEKLYEKAMKDSNPIQQIKLLIYWTKYLYEIEEDGEIKAIKILENELQKAVAPASSFMNLLLADLYLRYYRSVRYKINQRTFTATEIDSDITTWSRDNFKSKFQKLYRDCLYLSEDLKHKPLKEFDELLLAEEGSKRYRPTFYDFMIYNVLDFYRTEWGRLFDSDEDIKLRDQKYFDSAIAFMKYNLNGLDSSSSEFIILSSFQNLIRFHIDDHEPYALVDADINRLKYVYKNSRALSRDTLFQNALEKLYNKYQYHPVSTEIAFELASSWLERSSENKNDPDNYRNYKEKAYDLCNKTVRQFPKTQASKNCQSLIDEMLKMNYSVQIENAVVQNKPFKIFLEYQNIKEIFIRIIPLPYFTSGNYYWNSDIIEQHLRNKPVSEFKQILPEPFDYFKHKTEILMPTLEPGYYALMVSTDKKFRKDKTNLVTAKFWVTKLLLLYRRYEGKNERNIFYVVNRETGLPVQGVKAQIYQHLYEYRKSKIVLLPEEYITDENGRISIPYSNKSNMHVFLKYQNDFYYCNEEIYQYRDWNKENTKIETHFFTDRTIYRPGQTVYFKGILTESDELKSNFIVKSDFQTTIEIKDGNHSVIYSKLLTSNQFGSFSDTFNIPSGRLNGQWTLCNEFGYTHFHIEEYKRPVFETIIDTIKGNYRLYDTISVHGYAKSYAGTSIDNAKVFYRIVREKNWYYDNYENNYYTNENLQEIDRGYTKTDTYGNFEITFKADPDIDDLDNDMVIYRYWVTAEVTDGTGETRYSQKAVNVGKQLFLLKTDLPEIIDNKSFKSINILSKNLDDNFEPVKGAIKLQIRKNPDRLYKSRLWGYPDKHIIDKSDYKRLFPYEEYLDSININDIQTDKGVFTDSFNTGHSQIYNMDSNLFLKAGEYLLTLSSIDRMGNKIIYEKPLTIINPEDSISLKHVPLYIWTENKEYSPKDTAIIYIGSPYDSTSALIQIENRNKIISYDWIDLSKKQKKLKIPIHEDFRGDFFVHAHLIFQNRMYYETVKIKVPWNNKKLDISFQTYRNKLIPGEKEEWILKIKNPSNDSVQSEMIAELYDESLDNFIKHDWRFDIWPNNMKRFLSFEYFNYLSYKNKYGYYYYEGLRDYYYPKHRQKYDQLNFFQHLTYDIKTNSKSRFISINKNLKIKGKYGEIIGKVTDQSTGESLPGVNIIIDGTTIGAATNSKGEYRINDVPAGKYSLRASMIGYSRATHKNVKVRKQSTTYINFELSEESVSGEEVVIIAERPLIQKDQTMTMAIKSSDETDNRSIRPVRTSGFDLNKILARRNLRETAFFYPHLKTNEFGEIRISFTVPEALTRWRMMGLAHTKSLQIGRTEKSLITQKEVMIQPNAPRFLRENDECYFTAKVSNISQQKLIVKAQLMLFDAFSMKSIDRLFQLDSAIQTIAINSSESSPLFWKIKVPSGIKAVTYRVVAHTGLYSDGEESTIPVLPNKILVTESLPLPIRGQQTKNYLFERLIRSNQYPTIEHEQLTLEMTSNPSWLAILALPYMIEYPYECSEQIFSRYYANSISKFIVNSNSTIRNTFEEWKSSGTLESNLSKNQGLKTILLEETPWVLENINEKERLKRLELLFDNVKLEENINSSLSKLKELRTADGGWPWFSGGHTDRYITQHIISGFGHLQSMKIINYENENDESFIDNAVDYLDNQMFIDYETLNKNKISLEQDNIENILIHYLYSRSCFDNKEMNIKYQDAYKYWIKQSQNYWLNKNLMMQSMIALTLHRLGDTITSKQIILSLKNRAIYSDEFGMYWKTTNGYYWYEAPIESQAYLIEAFDEVMNDSSSVELMKIWLLKQKQVQSWNTTKSTAEACYSLLKRGTDLLASNKTVDVFLNNKKLYLDSLETSIEAGTGYFKKTWGSKNINNDMGRITIKKQDKGIAWGAMYWRYFDHLDNITSHKTPLKIKKQLLIRRPSIKGFNFELVTDTSIIRVGDLIKVRIELNVNRDMEYVFLKDMRAAGFEPLNVISMHKWQDGLDYFESTKDAATNFFISRLPRGSYVFEYPLRASIKGVFNNGISTIQCMYAPEFTSHTESIKINIK